MRIFGMILLGCWIFNLYGQTPLLSLHASVSFKRDSLQKQEVLAALGSFLYHIRDNQTDSANSTIQNLSTLALADEMQDSGVSWKVINLVRLNDSMYRLQLIAFRYHEIYGSFSLIALQRRDRYSLQSPLWWNMKLWKQKNSKGIRFYYASRIAKKKAKQFALSFNRFNQIIGAEYRQIFFLCCDDLSEALQLIGVNYKASLSGLNTGSVSQKGNKNLFIADGNFTSRFKAYDPHDFWHYCLYKWKPRAAWNKAVDEGCAYLYGGSWGLSWPQLLHQFHLFADTASNTNWLELYEMPYEFTGSKNKPLYVSYVLNALIIQRMQSESGYTAIRSLLSSGPYQKGNENYFRVLETFMGINRFNFNSRMKELIDQSR